jgi:hypothetical protein
MKISTASIATGVVSALIAAWIINQAPAWFGKQTSDPAQPTD